MATVVNKFYSFHLTVLYAHLVSYECVEDLCNESYFSRSWFLV